MREINIEGYSPDEILALPDEQLDALILSGLVPGYEEKLVSPPKVTSTSSRK
jgi:hypothetical protein